MFICINKEFFKENSTLYEIKTRNNKNLFQPQSNFSVYLRGPHYAGIKIYNNIPIQIKLLSGNFDRVKKAI